ncbi:hypothetical protein RBSWK_02325 [Rhodopirellula baltica SWK14]|uniref:Uncharacterized protein n=1 Tax=Rhodopirellula baltica SWK14 TaxID=993516 RepID=L7CHN5_RHOBT|nr:hypothetical protein RBSWK_02325 [Rhodopirellula baltica SWK14]
MTLSKRSPNCANGKIVGRSGLDKFELLTSWSLIGVWYGEWFTLTALMNEANLVTWCTFGFCSFCVSTFAMQCGETIESLRSSVLDHTMQVTAVVLP